MRLRFIVLACTITACGVEPQPGASTAASESTSELGTQSGGHGLIFDRHAHPYGASMVSWSQQIWSWIYRQPAATNPLLDPTGASCDVDQSGPVWFLPSIIPGASVFHGERTCTVPRHAALLVQTAAFLNDFPLSRPDVSPASGPVALRLPRCRSRPVHRQRESTRGDDRRGAPGREHARLPVHVDEPVSGHGRPEPP